MGGFRRQVIKSREILIAPGGCAGRVIVARCGRI